MNGSSWWKLEKNVNSGGLASKDSERNKNSVRDWAKDHSCDILTGSLASFYSCTRDLIGAEFKDSGLNCLVEEF